MKIVIALLVVAAVVSVLTMYACCAVAGRADDAAEEVWNRRRNV